MLWKKFNDQLAVFLLIMILILWIAHAACVAIFKVGLDGVIIGATISAFTLIIQFFFRKDKPPQTGDAEGKPPEPIK